MSDENEEKYQFGDNNYPQIDIFDIFSSNSKFSKLSSYKLYGRQ